MSSNRFKNSAIEFLALFWTKKSLGVFGAKFFPPLKNVIFPPHSWNFTETQFIAQGPTCNALKTHHAGLGGIQSLPQPRWEWERSSPSQPSKNITLDLGKTNHPTEGWVSTDRSVEAALLSTTPWPVTKSSANDFAPLHCTWLVVDRPRQTASRLSKVVFKGFCCFR